MLNKVAFSCSTLKGTNKKGVLKPDEDGYYTMPIGALNVFNSAGEYYVYESAKALFEDSSVFMRRVKTGCLKGEVGHPKLQKNQTMEEYAQRILTIDPTNVCAHFSEIWLDFDNVVDQTGKKIIAIMGKIIPSGPHGPSLQKSLDNPKEEVCFSIRSFTEDRRIGGIKQKRLLEIVTFDYVIEPGIYTAKKYFAPALESRVDTQFTKEQLIGALNMETPGVSMESARTHGLELFKSLGWTFEKGDLSPAWTKWE